MKTVVRYETYDCDDSISDAGIWDNSIDIEGEDYRRLISTCFKYSSCFSLIFRGEYIDVDQLYSVRREKARSNLNDYSQWDKYIIKSGSTNKWPGSPGSGLSGIIRYYRCCDVTLEMMFSMSNSIFKFMYQADDYMPEDPCFYREDGSVLFASTIHEGECYLFPREDEDFEKVFAANPWFKSDYPLDWYNEGYNNLAVFMEKEDFLKK